MRCLGSVWFILCVALTTAACATGPTTQRIPVTSIPEGAEVAVDSFKGVTPAVIEVSRDQPSYAVHISKEGYKTEIVRLRRIMTPAASGTNPLAPVGTSKASGSIAGDLAGGSLGMAQGGAAGTLFGVAVVAAELQSGARYRFYPVSINIVLEQGDPREVNDSSLREIERLKAQGVISEEEYLNLRERITKERK